MNRSKLKDRPGAPESPYGSVFEALLAAAPQLRVLEHTPERFDHRLKVLGLLQELRLLVERRHLKPH